MIFAIQFSCFNKSFLQSEWEQKNHSIPEWLCKCYKVYEDHIELKTQNTEIQKSGFLKNMYIMQNFINSY